MTERPMLSRRHGRTARSGPRAGRVRRRDTRPTLITPPPPPDEPTLFGLPAETDDAEAPTVPGLPPAVADPTPTEPALVVLRYADAVAGALLLVAGAAGGMSLFLPWVRHEGALGLALAQQGAEIAGRSPGDLVGSGLLLPVGVAVAGGVLLLLGLLAFRPAHTHRTGGVMALIVSLAVGAGVVVRTAAGASTVWADPGTVCALVLAGFGLLGALKAMLTGPEVVTDG